MTSPLRHVASSPKALSICQPYCLQSGKVSSISRVRSVDPRLGDDQFSDQWLIIPGPRAGPQSPQPLQLVGVRPEDPPPSWVVSLAGVDPAHPTPAMHRLLGDLQVGRQVAQEPFVGAQRLRSSSGVGRRWVNPQSLKSRWIIPAWNRSVLFGGRNPSRFRLAATSAAERPPWCSSLSRDVNWGQSLF